MIALIMAASLLGSVILICVCAPLAPLLLLLRRRRMSLRKMLPSALSMSSRSAARRLKEKAVVPHSLPRPETAAFDFSKAAVFW